MMTNARVNVLCKMKAEGLGGAQPPPIVKPGQRIGYNMCILLPRQLGNVM